MSICVEYVIVWVRVMWICVQWVTGWLLSDLCGVRNCMGGCDVDLVVWVTIRVDMK
jgi:hypothetical protein